MSDALILPTADGVDLQVQVWHPDGPPKAIVQLVHGMAEHAARYERFALALNDAGYVVYAHDHRGHGRTAGSVEATGVFAPANGWNLVVGDVLTVTQKAKEDHPGLPVFLVGHSMGSFLARTYVATHGREIAGLVLSGTAGDPGPLGVVGRAVAALEGRVRGRDTRSPLLDKATFGAYNKAFKPTRTDFDWLSRDPDEVDKYIADDYCGWVATSGFYADLLGGLRRINSDEHVALVPKDLPILLVAGDQDPVGDQGRGVRAVGDQFRKFGLDDVRVILYPGARHEILNETNRDEVTSDIIGWLDEHLPTARD